MADTSTNSFDIAAANQRGAPASFSNSATDWNAGKRVAYLETYDGISETRSSKWAAEFNKLDAKYGRDDSSMRLHTQQPFSN